MDVILWILFILGFGYLIYIFFSLDYFWELWDSRSNTEKIVASVIYILIFLGLDFGDWFVLNLWAIAGWSAYRKFFANETGWNASIVNPPPNSGIDIDYDYPDAHIDQVDEYSPLEIKVALDDPLEALENLNNASYHENYTVSIRGNPQVTYENPLILILKILDTESGMCIHSQVASNQEISTNVFESRVHLPSLYEKYFTAWHPVGNLTPDLLVAPFKGTRNINIQAHLFHDWENHEFYNFHNGIASNVDIFSSTSYVTTLYVSEDIFFTNSGYLEADDERLQVQKAAVILAVSIGFADGSFDKSEGLQIKNWIKTIVDSTDESNKADVKSALNSSFKKAYNKAENSPIDIKNVCNKIADIGSTADKISLLELCLDVMASDGNADTSELQELEIISKLIGVDYEQYSNLKDKRFLTLNPSSSSTSGLEEKLGIDKDWSSEKIKAHLLKEYSKWNGRLNTLSEGTARENAQSRLELIAEARKKYS